AGRRLVVWPLPKAWYGDLRMYRHIVFVSPVSGPPHQHHEPDYRRGAAAHALPHAHAEGGSARRVLAAAAGDRTGSCGRVFSAQQPVTGGIPDRGGRAAVFG